MTKKKLILLKNIPNSRLEGTNWHTLFQTKMVEIDTLFQTKKAKKKKPFSATHTYTAYIRDSPPGETNEETNKGATSAVAKRKH